MSAFVDFLNGFISELNLLSAERWCVLVEGQRDVAAMKSLGYQGPIFAASTLKRGKLISLLGPKGVVILTDMDQEGRRLAAKYFKVLSHEGLRPSLGERRRLLAASKGIFRHVENLGRFADEAEI